MTTAASLTRQPSLPRRAPAFARIAVLDDHWAVRAGLKAMIDAQPDMVYVGAASGEEELAWLMQRSDPSMLVLDVNHPGRDGLALTLRLKRRAVCPQIVLYSGRGSGPLLTAAAVVAGADAVVAKSATERELLEALRDAAHNRPAEAMPLRLQRRAAARLDPADHAILAMRSARISWRDIAATLAIDDRVLAARAAAMICRLSARESPDARDARAVLPQQQAR